MAEAIAYAKDHFELLFLFALVWMVVMALLAARRRTEHGLPVRPVVPPGARFAETWTSGRSKRSVIARLGGANNCLIVAVTDKAVEIHPHFPFNLFVGDVLGLDRVIPRENVVRVSEAGGMLGRTVEVEFKVPNGRETVELRLREPKRFLEAMQG
jgi:hypothetical protein